MGAPDASTSSVVLPVAKLCEKGLLPTVMLPLSAEVYRTSAEPSSPVPEDVMEKLCVLRYSVTRLTQSK